jgi:hypothetical protein
MKDRRPPSGEPFTNFVICNFEISELKIDDRLETKWMRAPSPALFVSSAALLA